MSNVITEKELIQLMQKYAYREINEGFILNVLHPYQDEKGNLLYFKMRLKHPDGRKWIRPFHFNLEIQMYEIGEPNFQSNKPLYYLPDLLERPEEIIWLVEGEACADCLRRLGLLVTTSGAANSIDDTNWSPLFGRKIIIWPDFDTAGQTYAETVSKILLNNGALVKMINTEELKLSEGGDCVDWLNQHPQAVKEDMQRLPLIECIASSPIADNNDLNRYPRFETTQNGVFYHKDENEAIRICSWLIVKALTRDAKGVNWGRVLEFFDADNVAHTWVMPMELLGGNGDELARELLRLGLRITPGNIYKKLLVEYITMYETSERARCVLKTGWHDHCFILPNKSYGSNGELVFFQSNTHTETEYHISGNLEEWKRNISLKCLGNSRLIFALSLAFAAPLLKFVTAESGGFHFRGESSSGKSTALTVAASVWGGLSYVQNWRVTDNGLEGLASQHNDTLLILDELSQINPNHAGEVAYMLANGQGKGRATKNGDPRQRSKWRLLFLSSGEISLSAHMMEVGKKIKAGQEVRMVDIPANAGSGMGIFEKLHEVNEPSKFADYFKTMCEKYHGVAADVFIGKLVLEDNLTVHTKIQDEQNNFFEKIPLEIHGQVKRVAQRFALVAAAGELATAYGITGWEIGASIAAAEKCFNAWLGDKEMSTSSYEENNILEQVRHFFLENAVRFDLYKIHSLEEQNHNTPYRCAGFRTEQGEFYVFSETFKNEICKGLGTPADVAKLLLKHGLLKKEKAEPTWIPIKNKAIRVYHFSNTIIGQNKEKESEYN
jgi:putative DNA primase/helicase